MTSCIKSNVLGFVFCAFALAAGAQTVTVAKSGSPTHTTVQEAIDSFAPDFDPAPNVIQITDSSVYDELIEVNVAVTIEGTASHRPILAAQARHSEDKTGISVYNGYPGVTTTQSIILKNLIILPSLSAPPNDAVSVSGRNLYFELNNVVITANNGSNSPVSTNGLTAASMDGAVSFGGDGLFMNGDIGFTGVLKDTVITHISSPTASRQDGMEMGVGYFGKYRVLDGCVFSYCKRLGICASGDFQIDAPTTKCLIINNTGFAGLWWYARGAGKRIINGAIVSNNSGFGIEHQNGDATGLTITNSILANNLNDNLRVSEVGTDANISLTNVTIGRTINQAASAIEIDPGSGADIFLEDCIIAGNGSVNANNTILHNGSGILNLTGTALVTAGPHSLVTATGGTGAGSGTPTTTADPQFVNTTDVASPDYFDVTNAIYGSANSAGGGLGGGADFVGGSDVKNWSVY